MEVFRITKAKFADQLYASGVEGRWNQRGEEVIYTASSRSLACLENLAHKGGRGGIETFRTMVIYVPDRLAVQHINLRNLQTGWNQITLHKQCQQIGSDWYVAKDTPVLKVPSAVIPDEFNYVLNARHPEFKEIKLIAVLPFAFDKRLWEDIEDLQNQLDSLRKKES
ncbi:RES family NAD+ phosphorylase [Rhodocytophaga aerolata]|uniref:RES family NAD+ phosphorylase n=1 Tax=Rhodocytophaga aerolata TaxID=455078 RepID=A0ABT8RIB6_9BACT|nr:RES family NAD+ phosphorylase [Rhodocytophaga aerolata]MDO1451714.1 RES family NAD+ phosphorylase [Rhodocytophaga aerolata]